MSDYFASYQTFLISGSRFVERSVGYRRGPGNCEGFEILGVIKLMRFEFASDKRKYRCFNTPTVAQNNTNRNI